MFPCISLLAGNLRASIRHRSEPYASLFQPRCVAGYARARRAHESSLAAARARREPLSCGRLSIPVSPRLGKPRLGGMPGPVPGPFRPWKRAGLQRDVAGFRPPRAQALAWADLPPRMARRRGMRRADVDHLRLEPRLSRSHTTRDPVRPNRRPTLGMTVSPRVRRAARDQENPVDAGKSWGAVSLTKPGFRHDQRRESADI